MADSRGDFQPPRRRYAIEWDEPGAGAIVDLFDGGKPVIVFSLETDWGDAWHPNVAPDGLQALHAIIDTADPARVARAEAENERLRTWLERIAQTDTPFMAHEWARQALEEAALSGRSEQP